MSEAEFEATGEGGVALRGASSGEGPPVVLAHGLTAHRDLVIHGSRALARAGHEVVRYDARAHGTSDAGAAGSRTYDVLARDLAAVIERAEVERPVLGGHSMGAHTIINFALGEPSRVAAMVLIGPASVGTPPNEDSLLAWDALAEGLESDGVDGFIAAYSPGLDPECCDTLVRIARERLGKHRDLDALAAALREVPRSVPFDGLSELEGLEVPALVVASHDSADPGHPHSLAEAWAESLPRARLISEREGESPLAWQGGKLSRAIAEFCAEGPVRERLAG